jgi:threonine dehydrogenase-like Zn-dependent dehydrogenase
MGALSLEVQEVPDPTILNDRDAIVKISSTAICGSDLHLYDGYIPAMKTGDILGHEFMGEVVEVGRGVSNLRVGDRVVVPFPIACGACNACTRELYSLCENSNPNAGMAEKLFGHAAAGIFGYSHLTGGYRRRSGGVRASAVRRRRAAQDRERSLGRAGPVPVGHPADRVHGRRVLRHQARPHRRGVGCRSDRAPRGAQCESPGAEKVIVIDRFSYRLDMARQHTGAETIDYEDVDVNEALKEMTGGRGPDACIDCVGMEAHHGTGLLDVYGKVKQRSARDGADAPRCARRSRPAGTAVSCRSWASTVASRTSSPIGSLMQRGLTIRTGQCHVHRYMRPLLDLIERGEIDPTFIVTHRLGLDEAPSAYETFKHKQDGCVKVVLTP